MLLVRAAEAKADVDAFAAQIINRMPHRGSDVNGRWDGNAVIDFLYFSRSEFAVSFCKLLLQPSISIEGIPFGQIRRSVFRNRVVRDDLRRMISVNDLMLSIGSNFEDK